MRRALLPLLVWAALSVGCGRQPADLYGTWYVDIDRHKEQWHGDSRVLKLPSPDEAGRITRLLAVSVQFAPGQVTVRNKSGTSVYDMAVLSASGDLWSLEVSGGGGKPEKWVVMWEGPHRLALRFSPDGPHLYLVR